jgi:hypothetical protein
MDLYLFNQIQNIMRDKLKTIDGKTFYKQNHYDSSKELMKAADEYKAKGSVVHIEYQLNEAGGTIYTR